MMSGEGQAPDGDSGRAGGSQSDGGKTTAIDTELEPTSVRSTYHRLRMVGLTAVEASNLTAHLSGLRITDRNWTLHEIEGVLFMRALVQRGRIPS
jgi:hypothetical protein